MIALPAAVLGGVAGAIAGSFLATLILRWPQGRSVSHGRSTCDGCGRTLGVIDLMPLLSGLMERGRCRICGARINPLHWAVEAGCAAIGALGFGLAPDIAGMGWALLGWILLTLAILDSRHFWLPDLLTFPMAALGLTVGLWTTDALLADRVVGAVAGYAGLLTVSLGYRALRGREGLGLGDAKLLGALGAWFGWQALPFVLLIAASAGLLAALGAMVAGQSVGGATRVPLGTFLAIAALPGWWVSRYLLFI